MMIRIARSTVRLCLLFTGILLILLAVLTLAARLGLPFVAGYKSDIEARVSDYLESPVEIGELALRWKGMGPQLSAENVAVIESDERQVTLDELLIDLDLPATLLRGIPVINELTLVGADLAIEADGAGVVRLHGMESVPGKFSRRSPDHLSEKSATDPNSVSTDSAPDTNHESSGNGGVDLLAWLFNARKVGLLDTRLTFIDVQAKRQLVMQNINIRAEKRGRVHQLRVDMRLPDSLGGSLEAGIDLTGSPRQASSADGDLYLKADSIKTLAWTELFANTPLLPSGFKALNHLGADVGFELWGNWRQGQLETARGQFSATDIADTALSDSLLDSVTGDLSISRSDQGITLKADALSFVKDANRALISDVELMQSNDGQLTGISAAGESLPLALVSDLIASVFRQHDTQWLNTLQTADVQGHLTDWRASLAGLDEHARINLLAGIENLSVTATESQPGFSALDGQISIRNSIGTLQLDGQSVDLNWPRLSRSMHQADLLAADLEIDLRNRHRRQLSGMINLAADGIDTDTRLRITQTDSRSPHLDIQSRFSASDISELPQWIPTRLLRQKSLDWFERAFDSGSASNGKLLFFGRLAEFPFDEGEGVFRASVDVENATLNYRPAWPALTTSQSHVMVNGKTLTIESDNAKMGSFDITQSLVRIDDLAKPVLKIDSSGRDSLQRMVKFANNGPLKSYLRPAMVDVSSTGTAGMDLSMVIPLYSAAADAAIVGAADASSDAVTVASKTVAAPPQFSVKGSVFLKDNTLRFARSDIDLQNVNGAVGFDHRGVHISNLRARWLGQPVSIDGKTNGRGRSTTTRLSLNGALKASDILVHYKNPLDQFITGTSSWQIVLDVPHSTRRQKSEGVVLSISSDLVGSALLLPRPLDKSTANARPLKLTTAFTDSKQQRWQVEYADTVTGMLQLDQGSFSSMSAAFGGAEPKPLPAEGIRLDGTMSGVQVDDWVDTVNRYLKSLPDSGGDSRILPVSANLRAAELLLGTQSLGPIHMQLNSDDIYLNATVDNEYLRGSLRYPRRYDEKKVAAKARVAHVDKILLTAYGGDDPLATPNWIDPRRLPPLQARISSARWDALHLQDVTLRTEPDSSGLRIDTLGFAYRTMQLVGKGHWRMLDPQGVNADLAGEQLTELDLDVRSDNFGEGLSDLGFPGVLAEGKGTVSANLQWPGPAYQMDLAKLGGGVRLDLERGRIVQLEPGAARIVGLFALQAIPRRLELDFKDVTSNGLSFKSIKGSLNLHDGIANAELVQLTGPIGVIDVTGNANLLTREYDQRVAVLPRVSAALPIIGAISGGASAGVGALVAGGFLKALGIDLDRLGLREYQLTGSWNKPELSAIPYNQTRNR